MKGTKEDNLSPKYLKVLRIQTSVQIRQLKSNDISGDVLYGTASAFLMYLTYTSYYNYQTYSMLPIYLFWYIVFNFHARINNQTFIATLPAITLGIMYLNMKFRESLDTFEEVYELYRTRVRKKRFHTNWDKALMNVVITHMSVSHMTVKLNSGLKYFFALFYFFGSIVISLFIIIIFFTKDNNNLLIKYLCTAFLIFLAITTYLSTLMAASLSKSGHQFYNRLNSLICRFGLKIQIKLKVSWIKTSYFLKLSYPIDSRSYRKIESDNYWHLLFGSVCLQ